MSIPMMIISAALALYATAWLVRVREEIVAIVTWPWEQFREAIHEIRSMLRGGLVRGPGNDEMQPAQKQMQPKWPLDNLHTKPAPAVAPEIEQRLLEQAIDDTVDRVKKACSPNMSSQARAVVGHLEDLKGYLGTPVIEYPSSHEQKRRGHADREGDLPDTDGIAFDKSGDLGTTDEAPPLAPKQKHIQPLSAPLPPQKNPAPGITVSAFDTMIRNGLDEYECFQRGEGAMESVDHRSVRDIDGETFYRGMTYHVAHQPAYAVGETTSEPIPAKALITRYDKKEDGGD